MIALQSGDGIGEERTNGKAPCNGLDDEFLMHSYKVLPCKRKYAHDWASCPCGHKGERAARRNLKSVPYMAIACQYAKQRMPCPFGEKCINAHNLFEYWLHPQRFKTELCQFGSNCDRPVCFFCHSISELRPLDPTLPPAEACWSAGAALAGKSRYAANGYQHQKQLPQQQQQQVMTIPAVPAGMTSLPVQSQADIGSWHNNPSLAAATTTAVMAAQQQQQMVLVAPTSTCYNAAAPVVAASNPQVQQQQQLLVLQAVSYPQASSNAAGMMMSMPAVTNGLTAAGAVPAGPTTTGLCRQQPPTAHPMSSAMAVNGPALVWLPANDPAANNAVLAHDGALPVNALAAPSTTTVAPQTGLQFQTAGGVMTAGLMAAGHNAAAASGAGGSPVGAVYSPVQQLHAAPGPFIAGSAAAAAAPIVSLSDNSHSAQDMLMCGTLACMPAMAQATHAHQWHDMGPYIMGPAMPATGMDGVLAGLHNMQLSPCM